MPYPKEFSVILFLFLVVVAAYFVSIGRLGGLGFGGTIVTAAVAVGLIHNLDTLTRLGWKSGGVEATMEVARQLRQDVFAKAVQVQRLAEQMGAMSAWAVANTNRFVGPDFQQELLRRRDELRAMLSELDVPPERHREIVMPITRAVANDYRGAVMREARNAVVQAMAATEEQRNVVVQQIVGALDQPDQRKALDDVKAIAQRFGLSLLPFRDAVQRYTEFLRSNPEVAVL